MDDLLSGLIEIDLREPCKKCDCPGGVVKPKNGQNCAYCAWCGEWAGYNVPKSELGQARESLSSRPGLKPKQRARILDRDSHRCVSCGRTPPEVRLDIEHLLSVKDGRSLGATDAELWDDENLAVFCAECNSGYGSLSISLRLVYLILQARTNGEEGVAA